jgi:hypothetical protein
VFLQKTSFQIDFSSEVSMNSFVLTYLGILLAMILVSVAFAWLAKREAVQAVSRATGWLLKISYFDFIKLIIFIKPLKKYSEQVGILVWLILVFVVGRYILITRPKITEISGPYIPMIGYVYYLTVLFIIHLPTRIFKKAD